MSDSVIEWRSWGWKIAQILKEKINEADEKNIQVPYLKSLLQEYKELRGE
jgi:hypothetical protein